MKRAETLWSAGAAPNAQMLAYTVADDREVDARLLRWDVLGSLGHVEALAGGNIISARDRVMMRRALRAALRAIERGTLRIGSTEEDGHSAVEFWLTRRFGDLGRRLHTGRSRNDQVATDLRLLLKDTVLTLHEQMGRLIETLIGFAAAHRRTLWPGFTHQRAAMPSSGGLWAAGYAEALLDAAAGVNGFWPRLDRSPLGSAAGYGVPLPLARERAAHALGFAGIDEAVTSVQNTRGEIEAAVLFWCSQAARQCARLSADVILFSAAEFGWIVLPPGLSTGSSIMPQKRNPDLFELTRARAAALDGDLASVLAISSRLPGGYHRDFQFLKAPLLRGVDRTREMLAMLNTAIPQLGVDGVRARSAMTPDLFATDEVMRRVGEGVPFRKAYHDVAAELRRGVEPPVPSAAAILQSRSTPGGMGALPLRELRRRIAEGRRWNARQRRRFDGAMHKLAGPRAR